MIPCTFTLIFPAQVTCYQYIIHSQRKRCWSCHWDGILSKPLCFILHWSVRISVLKYILIPDVILRVFFFILLSYLIKWIALMGFLFKDSNSLYYKAYRCSLVSFVQCKIATVCWYFWVNVVNLLRFISQCCLGSGQFSLVIGQLLPAFSICLAEVYSLCFTARVHSAAGATWSCFHGNIKLCQIWYRASLLAASRCINVMVWLLMLGKVSVPKAWIQPDCSLFSYSCSRPEWLFHLWSIKTWCLSSGESRVLQC